jgi:hypothetical protein
MPRRTAGPRGGVTATAAQRIAAADEGAHALFFAAAWITFAPSQLHVGAMLQTKRSYHHPRAPEVT